MGTEYTFYDYIDADRDGSNVIKSWLNGDGKSAEGKFFIRIELLEGSPPRGFQDTVWHHPFVDNLKEEWKGFIEIRIQKDEIQYRLIGQKQDRDVLLVTWGYHDGKGWNTDIPPGTAKIRVKNMLEDPLKYRRKHEI